MSTKLSLQEARDILKRAIEKGRELDWISTHAVVDEGGNLISMSRADGAPAGAAPLARAKAYLAAVTGRPTVLFANRMDAHPLRYFGYRAILSRPVFPGPGGVPILRDGKVRGGYSSDLSSDAADLVTAHAVEADPR
jgi:uncharacterized protein GlcG (DUF336 family)